MSGYLDDLDIARGYFLPLVPLPPPANSTLPVAPSYEWSFNSPVTFFDMVVLNGTASITLQEPTGSTTFTSGPGQFFNVTNRNVEMDFYADSPFSVTWLSSQAGPNGGTIAVLSPLPPPSVTGPLELIRLSNGGQQLVVVQFLQSQAVLSPFSYSTGMNTTVVASGPLGYYRPQGDYVTINTCLLYYSQCIWTWVNQTALLPFTIQAFTLTFSVSLVGRQQNYVGRNWTVQLPYVPTYNVSITGNIAQLELITVANLSSTCACPPPFGFNVNQSVLNAEW